MRRAFIAAALTPLAAVAADPYSPTDFGGSVTVIGAGARALGMGGAFTAIADDATANTWNPAGMTQLERPEAAISGGYYGRINDYGSGTAHEDDMQLDHVSVVLPLGTSIQQTIGLAWQRQYDFTSASSFALTETVPLGGGDTQVNDSQYHIAQSGSFAALGLSYAIEPVYGISFGATVWCWDDNLTQASEYRSVYHSHREDVFTVGGAEIEHGIADSRIDETVTVDHGTSFGLGGLWRIDSSWTIGLSIKPRFRLDLDRRVDRHERVQELVAATDSTADSVEHRSSRLQLPTNAVAGVAWRLDDQRTIAFDLGWTRWSELREVQDGITIDPVNRQIDPDDVRDGISLRLGYEHIVELPRVVLVPRAGLLYEQLPGRSVSRTPSSTEDVHAEIQHWFGATVGLSVFQRDVIFDLAAQGRQARGIVGPETPVNARADVTTWVVRAGVAFQF